MPRKRKKSLKSKIRGVVTAKRKKVLKKTIGQARKDLGQGLRGAFAQQPGDKKALKEMLRNY